MNNNITSSSNKRKARQSQTPSENPHQEEQKCEEEGNNHDHVKVPYIPIPIITEILSRARIKTIFNCRLVCKSWNALISTTDFAQLHLSRSPTRCLIKSINKKRQSKRLHLIDPQYPYRFSSKLVFIPDINLPKVPLGLGLINSCNGLACLCQLISLDFKNACNIFVCNPVLREYITIPKPPNIMKFHIYSCAFGFSHIANQYKVVLSFYDVHSSNYKADIYTLGKGSWRSIENVPYRIRNNNFNAFINGALHWTGAGPECPSIQCFDFVTEEFRAVPIPSVFDKLERYFLIPMHVGVINENLAVCDFIYYVDDRVIIWVMKDYGVKESWSKEFVFTHMIHGANWDTFEPLMVKGSGEILMLVNNDFVLLYDPKSEAFESKLKIFSLSSDFMAIAHVPSLISLKHVAKGENLKVLGSN